MSGAGGRVAGRGSRQVLAWCGIAGRLCLQLRAVCPRSRRWMLLPAAGRR
jgi:hypothetical protein